MSNFRPAKNIRTLIKVFDLISKKHKCIFNLIGEGPELEVAKEITKELKIPDVYFLEIQMKLKKNFVIRIFLFFHQRLKVLDWLHWRQWPLRMLSFHQIGEVFRN